MNAPKSSLPIRSEKNGSARIVSAWENCLEEAEGFYLDQARAALESLAVSQEVKELYPRDSEEEILCSSMVHDQALIAEYFIEEAKDARQEIKRRRSERL